MRSRHITILASTNRDAWSDNDEGARDLLQAETAAAVELCWHQIADLEGMIRDAREAGFAEGVRVARRYLRAVLETLRRHEQILAALEAGLSDAELVRAIEANRQALAGPWARAQRSFNRARAREVRVARAPRLYRAHARHLRPTYRRRAPRRATGLSVPTSAGDGSPPAPPEPDPAEQTAPQGASPSRGAS